jgi:hypothetical protein
MRKKAKKRSPERIAKDKAWTVFSKWIRERDNHTCITCGKDRNTIQKNGKKISIHAGHYIHNRESFNERNIHAQCMGCNWRKKGNMRFYTVRMVEWYSLDYVKYLLSLEKTPIKLESGEYYLDIIEKYS